MGDTQTLNLVIDANTEIAREQLKGLGGIVENLGEKFRTTNSLVAGFAGGFAGGLFEGVGEKFIDAAKEAFKFAGELGEVAERAGTTTDALQKMRFAVIQTGGDSEQADKGLAVLNARIGDAISGNRAAAQSFKLLGVDLVDAGGKTRPLIDVYRDVAAAIARLPDPAQQAAAAQRVFKESGTDLLPLLREGAAGFDRYADAAAKLGLVLTPEDIERAHAAQVELDKMKEVLSVEFAKAITANADSLLSLAKGLTSAAEGLARYAAQDPERIREVAAAAAGAAAGGRIGGLPGAAVGAVAGGFAGADKQRRGSTAIFNSYNDNVPVIGGFLGAAAVVLSSRERLIAAADAADRKAVAKRGGGTITAGGGGAGRVGDAPNPYANQVLTQLGNRASFGGDARAAFIASQLSAAHVDDPTSTIGRQIVAAAGKAYDDGPGKLKAATDARRSATAARTAEIARLAAATRLEAGDRDVTTAQRAARNATAAASDSPEARYDADRANIQDNLDDKLAQNRKEGPAGTKKYTDAQVKLLDQAAQTVAIGQQIVLDKREEERKLQEKLALQESDFANQQDVLQTQLALATTTGERRDIELHLLDLQIAEEKAREEAVIASKQSTEAEKEIARRRLATIDQTAPGRREAVEKSNQGALADYGDRIVRTKEQANEALEGVAAGGLKSLEDGLVGIVTGTESVGQAFKKMAAAIISDLIRIAIEYAIIGPILGALGFPSVGGFGGPRAAGGPVEGGKTYLVGEEGPELFTAPGGGGNITPNRKLTPTSPGGGASAGGGAGTTNVFNVDARGASDPGAVRREVQRGLFEAAPAFSSVTKAQTISEIKRPRLPGARS